MLTLEGAPLRQLLAWQCKALFQARYIRQTDRLQISKRQGGPALFHHRLLDSNLLHPHGPCDASCKIYTEYGGYSGKNYVPLYDKHQSDTLLLQLLVSLAAAMSLLAMWIAIKARENTTHLPKSSSNGPVPGAQVTGFNAAASVNMGVWLFFWIWMANT